MLPADQPVGLRRQTAPPRPHNTRDLLHLAGEPPLARASASPRGRRPVRRHQAPARAGPAARAGARRAAGEAARPSGPGAAGSGRLRREARPGSGRLRRAARPASPSGAVCPGGGTRRNHFMVRSEPPGALGATASRSRRGHSAGRRRASASQAPAGDTANRRRRVLLFYFFRL